MELMSTHDIRVAVQEIATATTERTADRLRAYNLLYGWCRGTDEALPETTEELLDLLRRRRNNGRISGVYMSTCWVYDGAVD